MSTSVVQALHKTDPDGTYNAFYWAQNVVAPIPSVLKPLLKSLVEGDIAQGDRHRRPHRLRTLIATQLAAPWPSARTTCDSNKMS